MSGRRTSDAERTRSQDSRHRETGTTGTSEGTAGNAGSGTSAGNGGGAGPHQMPACAECRRVKRRCNRKWPCSSCVRRGCASICPDGTLTPGGGGNRYILHGSEELHKKIQDMSIRIGLLEDALAALWVRDTRHTGREASEIHPLLRPDLLALKQLPDTQNSNTVKIAEDDGEESDDPVDEIVEEIMVPGLESLALGGEQTKERTERLGISTIEFRLNSEERPEPSPDPSSQQNHHNHVHVDGTRLPLAPTIFKIAEKFPSSVPTDSPIDLSTLLLYVPPLPLALRLTKSYFDNAGWTYCGINREGFLRDVLVLFYDIVDDGNSPDPSGPGADTQSHSGTQPGRSVWEPLGSSKRGKRTRRRAHELALMYMVFAIGAIVDLDSPSIHDQTQRYYTLAKAAVCMDSPLESGSITLVQVLSFMTDYAYMWEVGEVKMDQVAVIMSLASKIGLTHALHREAPLSKLDEREAAKRRWVFWELLTDNAWQSLSSGRPPSIQIAHADCQIPNDPVGEMHQHPHDVEKFHFARECLWPIIDSNFNLSKPVNYASLLALDRKVREFQYSDVSQLLASPGVTYGLQMQTHASNYVKEHVLLHLNRAFFSRAMAANPDSPHDTPYASSFLAIFRCSVTLLESVKTIYEKLPAEVIPFGLCWTDVLMSAVAMGTICSRGPRGSFAPLAFEHLKVAVQLAETRFIHQPRAKSGLPVLQKMVLAAHQAIAAIGPGPASALSPPSSASAQQPQPQHPPRGRSQPPSKNKKQASPDKDRVTYSHDPRLNSVPKAKGDNGLASTSSQWSMAAPTAPQPEGFYPDFSMNFDHPNQHHPHPQPPINGGLPVLQSSLNNLPPTALNTNHFPLSSGGSGLMDFDQSSSPSSAPFHSTYGPDSDITMFSELLPQERSGWNFANIFNNDGRMDTAQSNGAFDGFLWNLDGVHNSRPS